MAALYLNHPYGRSVIGWRQEIEKLNREDALVFYRRFYAPNNAILVIAGDVEVADVRPLVERNFGAILPRPAIPARRIRPQEPEPAAPRTVTLSDPRVEQPSLRRYYLVPSATTAAAGESDALDVLAQLVGSGSNSYLYRALVVDKPLAVSASASYSSISPDPTRFAISASPKPGVGFAEVEGAIDGVIADVARNPVRAEDLERVKTHSRYACRARRRYDKGDRGGGPPYRRGWTDSERTRRRKVLSQRLADAGDRHVLQFGAEAAAASGAQAADRLHREAQRHRRCRDSG
ncbi:putative Zn-dependent peptidase [Bradyrhizobium sp. USDA 4472]